MKRFLALTAALALLFTCTAFAGTEEESLPDAALDTDRIQDAGETEAPAAETFRIQLFNTPQAIKLPKATTSYWFQLPEGVQAEKASLSLVLLTSDTLLEDYSTATVEVNGVAVASVNLQELKKTAGTVWEVEIPAGRLKADGTLNQLSVVTAQRSILGDCADIDNPANWLILGEDSALYLTFRQADACLLSGLYPFLFNRADLGNELNAALVLAGSDRDAEAAAALTAASAIGAAYPYKDIASLAVTTGTGSTGNCFVFDADAAGSSLDAGEGALSVRQEDGLIVRVSGGGTDGLEKAVRVLTDRALLSQFTAAEAVIRTDPGPRSPALAAREDGLYTLADFGYADMNLAGAFHQQATFSVRQPDGVLGGAGSYFEIHFRHSDALVSDTSLLTVLFDGVPASSIQLSRSNVDGGKLRVAIPGDVLAKGSFEIGVDVYNYLGKIDCSKDWYDVAWTTIAKDSVVYLEPGDNTLVPSLARFPALWGAETVVCLPEGASDTLLQAMASLALLNGQHTQAVTDYRLVHALTAQDAQDANIILAGARDRIVLPEEIAAELYVLPAGDRYEVKDNAGTIPEALEDKILLQAVRSPYNYKKTVYVLLWADDAQEEKLADLAADRERLNGLSGELALIGPGPAVCLNAAQAREASIPLSPETLMAKAVRATGISRLGLILIAVLVLLILILIIRQIRMRNRFSKAKAKMEQQNNDTAGTGTDQKAGNDTDDFDKDE